MFEWSYWGYGSAFALIAWIPFSFWRFSRVRPTLAAAQVVLWGMMWLPEGAAFDLPALPPFSKYTISAVCVLLGLLWKAPERLRAARIGRGSDLLVSLMIMAQVGTVLTNSDALHYGSWKTIDIPGFTPYDGISAAVRVLLTVGLPCVLGRALLRSDRDLHDLLETLAIAGVAYSLPILYEVRMSPVLHDMVYGYAPRTDWSQNLRAGGYRPTAFMGHGLVVGFFMFLCTMAAMTLQKAGRKRLLGQPIAYVVGYLWLILLLCKAAAPIIYAAVGFAVLHYLSSNAQARVLVLLGLVVLSYPITRILNMFPVEGILSMAGALGPDRVQSLQFRFDNEDILLLKGAERLWFGWGGYGRERVFDAETAKDLVIQDGQWIVVFGQAGLVGFLCYFSTLLAPVWQLARGLKRVVGRPERSALVGFGFCVVVCSVNMLPNMQLPYLQFLFASGLAVAVACVTRQGSRPAPALSMRPSPSAKSVKAGSIRPSRSVPLRPVWYGTPPPGAYVSDPAPPRTGPVAQAGAPTPANDVSVEQERSRSVQTVVIRAVTERPTMRPPAPTAGTDLSAPDLAGAAAHPDASQPPAQPTSAQPEAKRRSEVVPVSAHVPVQPSDAASASEPAQRTSAPSVAQSGMTSAAEGGKVSERAPRRLPVRAALPGAGSQPVAANATRASQRPLQAPPPANGSNRPASVRARATLSAPPAAGATSAPPSARRSSAAPGSKRVMAPLSAPPAAGSVPARERPSVSAASATPKQALSAPPRVAAASEKPESSQSQSPVSAAAEAARALDVKVASVPPSAASTSLRPGAAAASQAQSSLSPPETKSLTSSARPASAAPSVSRAASAPASSGTTPPRVSVSAAEPAMSASAQAVARAMGVSSKPKPPRSAAPMAGSPSQPVAASTSTRSGVPAMAPSNDVDAQTPGSALDVGGSKPVPANDVPAVAEAAEPVRQPSHSVPPPPPRAA